MQGPILVFAESSGSEFRKSAFEAVTEARRLAEFTELEINDDQFIPTRPASAGKVLLKVKMRGNPKVATLRPNVFTAKERVPAISPSVQSLSFERPSTMMTVKEFVTHGAKKQD